MLEYLLQHLWAIWTLVAMLCLIMEMSSGDFYITCFGIGAIVALIVSLFAARSGVRGVQRAFYLLSSTESGGSAQS